MTDIAARMKEALSQIRHSKSERPVFTPEFLARIKRIIVFRPLDRDAMKGICIKLLEDMAGQWEQRRNKRLSIADAFVEAVADQAHQANEKSQHKEGGRIVRRLIADLVEEPIQRAIAERPDEYSRCTTVELRLVAAVDGKATRAVVQFVNSGHA